MANAIMFKVGTGNSAVDYSNRVIAGSYDIQTKPVYTSWVDGNGVEHRQKIRNSRTEGSFDMFFKSMTEYDSFISQVSSSTLADLRVPCTVKSNTTNIEVTSYFFIDFSPVRNRDGAWKDYMERFTVTIKEA